MPAPADTLSYLNRPRAPIETRRKSRARLLMLPLWIALLHEGACALDPVVAGEGQPEGLLLVAQSRVLLHRERRAQRVLGLAQGDGRLRGEPLGELARRRYQFLGRHDLVHQPQRQGRFRVKHVAGQYEFARARMADSMRQTLRAAKAWNQRQIDLRLAEARLLAGDYQVARHRQFQSAAERKAVDRGDNRDRQILEALHHTMTHARKLQPLAGGHLG